MYLFSFSSITNFVFLLRIQSENTTLKKTLIWRESINRIKSKRPKPSNYFVLQCLSILEQGFPKWVKWHPRGHGRNLGNHEQKRGGAMSSKGATGRHEIII